jgi:hypothetical protein
MLSRTSRQEILTRLETTVGRPINEENLSPSTRQAITNLAAVQRNLLVISEVLRGEQSRVDRSALLSLSSRLHGDHERDVHSDEIKNLQAEIDNKVAEISNQIFQEEKARQSGQPLPQRTSTLEADQLKCPTCGAPLPMPTGRYLECQYCKATLSIQDVSPQIKTMIQGI